MAREQRPTAYLENYPSVAGRTFTAGTAGEWKHSAYESPDDDLLLPGLNAAMPPAHPMKWLDQRALADTAYTGISNIDRHPVYVVTGRIPLLPGRVIDELSVPADNVRIYIDTKAFNVIRVEVDRNILDSQREDVGYQVIPGVVDVKTVETIEFSRHNGFIEIALPGVAPAVAKLSG